MFWPTVYIPLGRVDTKQMDVPHCIVQRLTPGFPRCFASVMWVCAQRDSSHISLSITDKHPRWKRKQICGNHFIISPRVPLRATLTVFHNRLWQRICTTFSGESKDDELRTELNTSTLQLNIMSLLFRLFTELVCLRQGLYC